MPAPHLQGLIDLTNLLKDLSFILSAKDLARGRDEAIFAP
jgi:hypothetical protein